MAAGSPLVAGFGPFLRYSSAARPSQIDGVSARTELIRRPGNSRSVRVMFSVIATSCRMIRLMVARTTGTTTRSAAKDVGADEYATSGPLRHPLTTADVGPSTP